MNAIEANSKDEKNDANIDKVDQLTRFDLDQEQIPIVLNHRRTYSIIMASVMAGTTYYLVRMILNSEFTNFQSGIWISLFTILLYIPIIVSLFGVFVFTKNTFRPTYLVIKREGIEHRKGLFNFKALRPISYDNISNAYYSAVPTKHGHNHILNLSLVSDVQDSLTEYSKHNHIAANLNMSEEETFHHVALVNALIADYNKVA